MNTKQNENRSKKMKKKLFKIIEILKNSSKMNGIYFMYEKNILHSEKDNDK